MDTKLLIKTLPICFKAQITPLIVGVQGTGKTQSIFQAVEGQNIGKVFSYHLSQNADVGDLIGLLDMSKSENFCQFKLPKRIYDIIEYCKANPTKFGVLFFDELNRGHKDLLQAVFELILEGNLNGFAMPSNFRCVAAMNPPTDDFNVLDFKDCAFSDRLAYLPFDPSVKSWLSYARDQHVTESIIGFIEENNKMLDPKNNMDKYEIPADKSRRTWMAFDRVEKLNPDEDVFQILLTGMVGLEPAQNYLDFRKKHTTAIEGKDILNKYKSVKEKVIRFGNPETDRTDILSNACDRVLHEMKNMKTLNKTQEKNLSEFICDLPKEVASGLVQTLFDLDSFLSTASDKEHGLASGTFAASKRLLDHFDGWDRTLEKPEEKTEEKSEDTHVS